MTESCVTIPVKIYPESQSLSMSDQNLLHAAQEATSQAYAPYSNFRVGVALRLRNGVIVTGSNQENASFPAGICAERVALSAATSLHPGIAIEQLALSYVSQSGISNKPISPCGICRQTLAEYEHRFNQPIRMIMGGNAGQIFVLDRATDLLPFAFSSQELNPL